jgi:uncharacterized membrane protein
MPYQNTLSPILMLAGVVIVLMSPRKLSTLGRMVIALVAVFLVLLAAVALFRRTADPEAFGVLAAQVSLGAADAVGALHLRRLRRVPPMK